MEKLKASKFENGLKMSMWEMVAFVAVSMN
jgi:hypothetical protein